MAHSSTDTTILDLEELNVAAKLAEIRALQAQAAAYARMGGPVLPGIPNIPAMIRALLKGLYENLLAKGREMVKKLIQILIAAASAEAIPAINAIIHGINEVIKMINTVIDKLFPAARSVFYVIIALTIVYVVSKVIGMIPAPFVGMGSGIAFTSFITIVNDIMNMTGGWLAKLHSIGFAIISVMLMLLGFYAFLEIP